MNINISIREAVLEDYSIITILNKDEMGYDYSEKETKIQLESLLKNFGNKIYVAVVNGKVAGYIHANNYDLLYAPPYKNIMGIAVSQEFKRLGIGKMLLGAVEKWGMDSGACGVRLVSGATRKGAHAFYEACGYESCKMQKNYKKVF